MLVFTAGSHILKAAAATALVSKAQYLICTNYTRVTSFIVSNSSVLISLRLLLHIMVLSLVLLAGVLMLLARRLLVCPNINTLLHHPLWLLEPSSETSGWCPYMDLVSVMSPVHSWQILKPNIGGGGPCWWWWVKFLDCKHHGRHDDTPLKLRLSQ